MNILFLSTWFPHPADNGSKIRVYYLLRALGIRHKVTLLSFAFDTANPNNAEKLFDFCENLKTVQRNPFERGLLANTFRFFSPVPIVTLPVPEMAQAVRSVLTEIPFDVVIASNEVTATYAQLMRHTIPKVLEEHNSLTCWMWERYEGEDPSVQRLRNWISWQKTRYYEARLFRGFDLVTMVSKRDREISLSTLPGYQGWVEVVPNGVDCQHNSFGLTQPAPKTLIFNGALTYYANYDAMQHFLEEVYPQIKRSVPEVSLTITGSTSGIDISNLRFDESTHLSGYVHDIRPLVAGAWVCVVPIRQGGGTRLKILEAMALGTPVVATSKGAEGLDLTPDRHILIADQPAEFAAQVVRLLGDHALRHHLATNARHLVEERYDWLRIGERFVELIEEVISSHNQCR